MRFLSGLFLIVLVAVLALLTYENSGTVSVSAWTWHADFPLSALVGGVYVLGMLSGWWLIGTMKRSWQRVTEPDRVRA